MLSARLTVSGMLAVRIADGTEFSGGLQRPMLLHLGC